MTRLENRRSIIVFTKHAEKRLGRDTIKCQTGWHLQKYRTALFSERACLLQKSLQRFFTLNTQFTFMGDCPGGLYGKAKIIRDGVRPFSIGLNLMFAIKTGVDLSTIQFASIANEVTSCGSKMLRMYSRYAPACCANIKDVEMPPRLRCIMDLEWLFRSKFVPSAQKSLS